MAVSSDMNYCYFLQIIFSQRCITKYRHVKVGLCYLFIFYNVQLTFMKSKLDLKILFGNYPMIGL